MANEEGRRTRPKGPLTRLQARAIELAKANGALPHEILLDMARGNPQKVRTVVGRDEETGLLLFEEEWVSMSLEQQMDAAKAASPYYAPKLSTVETVQGMGDADIDALIEQFAAQAGLAVAPGGEGQEEPKEARADAGDRPARRRLS